MAKRKGSKRSAKRSVKRSAKRGKKPAKSISLFEHNPRRYNVKPAKTTARKKGTHVCKDARTGKNVAHGSKKDVSSYCYNLAKQHAHPKYRSRSKSKKMKQNPTKATKATRSMKTPTLAALAASVRQLSTAVTELRQGQLMLAKEIAKHKQLMGK